MLAFLRIPSSLQLFALLLINVVSAQVGCSICGPGLAVGNPDVIFRIPGHPLILCGELEQAGEVDLLPAWYCSFLPDLVLDVCDCGPVGNTGGAPSFAPNPSAILGSPAPSSIPEPPVFEGPPTPTSTVSGCNMCRQPGYTINNPIGTMSVPGYLNGLSFFCYYVQQQAALGTFDEATCELLPDLVDESCGGCRNGAPPAYPPITSLPISPSAAPVSFDNSISESSGDVGSYMMYLIFGLVFFFGLVIICYLKFKINRGRSVEMTATSTIDRADGGTNINFEEEQAAAQLAMDEKLRPLVLRALFPEQKVSTNVLYVSLNK
jgi:hypothetical protein